MAPGGKPGRVLFPDLVLDEQGDPKLIHLSAAELGTRIHERLEADLNQVPVSRETDPGHKCQRFEHWTCVECGRTDYGNDVPRTYDLDQVTITIDGQPFDPSLNRINFGTPPVHPMSRSTRDQGQSSVQTPAAMSKREEAMKSKDIEYLIFTDVETTGLKGPDTRLDAIVEVAAAKVRLADRVIVDSYQTLIRPTAESDQVTWTADGWAWDLGKFHLDGGHFNGVDWHGPGAVALEEAMYQIAIRFAPGATFAGQNIPFDLDHIQRDCAASEIPWPATDYHRVDLCSPAIFLVMAGATPGISLKHTRVWARDREKNAGLPPLYTKIRDMAFPPSPLSEQAHRAMADVEDAIRIFWAMADVFALGLRADFLGIT